MILLRFTNQWGERFFFQNLGQQWPHMPERRMIERTTPKRDDATPIESVEKANEILVIAGNPKGWELIEA